MFRLFSINLDGLVVAGCVVVMALGLGLDARVLQLSVVGDLIIDDGGSRAVAGAINDGCYGCCYDGIKLIYVCLV